MITLFIYNEYRKYKGALPIFTETIADYQANYKAIIHSVRLSKVRKNTLLENLLTEIEHIFFATTCDQEFSIIEQQSEAKRLHEIIKTSLIAY